MSLAELAGWTLLALVVIACVTAIVSLGDKDTDRFDDDW